MPDYDPPLNYGDRGRRDAGCWCAHGCGETYEAGMAPRECCDCEPGSDHGWMYPGTCRCRLPGSGDGWHLQRDAGHWCWVAGCWGAVHAPSICPLLAERRREERAAPPEPILTYAGAASAAPPEPGGPDPAMNAGDRGTLPAFCRCEHRCLDAYEVGIAPSECCACSRRECWCRLPPGVGWRLVRSNGRWRWVAGRWGQWLPDTPENC